MGVLIVILCVWIGIKLIIPLGYLLLCWLLGLNDNNPNDNQGE